MQRLLHLKVSGRKVPITIDNIAIVAFFRNGEEWFEDEVSTDGL